MSRPGPIRNGRLMRIGTLALVVLATLSPRTATADGGLMPRLGYFLHEYAQSAVIIFDEVNQQEDLFVHAGFRGDATDFAWLIPVPAVPEVELADRSILAQAESLTQPLTRSRGEDWGCSCRDEFQTHPDYASGGGVEIYDDQLVGPYAVRVVGADSTDVLADSLTAWGYLHAENEAAVTEVLEYYVAREWVFVALRFDESAFDPYSWEYEFWGGTEPVHLTFASDQPIYPMRISAISSDEYADVTLFVCAARRMTFPGAKTEYANAVDSSERGEIMQALSTFGALLPEHCYITRLTRIYTPAEMDADIVLVPARSNREFRQIDYGGLPPVEGLLVAAVGLGLYLHRRRRV